MMARGALSSPKPTLFTSMQLTNIIEIDKLI